MHSFKDKAGNEWRLDGTLAVAEKVKAKCEVNLYALHESNFAPLDSLIHNPPKLMRVIHTMATAGDAITTRTAEDLAAAWDAEVGDAATTAFLDAWIDMQPGKDRRESLRKMVDVCLKVDREFSSIAASQLDSATADVLKRMHEVPLTVLLAEQKPQE